MVTKVRRYRVTSKKMKGISAELADFSRRARLFDEQYADLLKQHPYKWVAMLEDESLVFAEDRQALWDAIRAAGKPTNTAVFAFLDPHPRRRIR